MTRAHMESHATWISRNVNSFVRWMGWTVCLLDWFGKTWDLQGMNLGTISNLGGRLYCKKTCFLHPLQPVEAKRISPAPVEFVSRFGLEVSYV